MTECQAGSTVIELTSVARTYPGPAQVRALHDVNLSVRRGEYLAVVGPSGSGKSTLLNVLGLLDRPSEGDYRLDGIATRDLPDAARTALRGSRIGFVFQQFRLLSYRTAEENVMLAQTYVGARRAKPRERASAALARVGLEHRTQFLPSRLSGGEQQRVAIARALAGEPSLLLCDEPTGNLDSRNTQIVLELFDELHAVGLTLVVITHDDAVSGRAQRRVRISDGVLTQEPS
jgi:putative ABC transport system ATP-binding protein